MTTIDLLKKIYFYVGLKERLLWGLSVFLATVSAGIGLFLPTQLNLLFQKFENFNFNDMIILVLLFFLQSIIMYVSLYVLGKIGEYIILQLRKESALSLLQSEVFNLESTTWASRVIYNPGFFSDLISRQFNYNYIILFKFQNNYTYYLRDFYSCLLFNCVWKNIISNSNTISRISITN